MYFHPSLISRMDLCRWAHFRLCIDDIEAGIKALREGNIPSPLKDVFATHFRAFMHR